MTELANVEQDQWICFEEPEGLPLHEQIRIDDKDFLFPILRSAIGIPSDTVLSAVEINRPVDGDYLHIQGKVKRADDPESRFAIRAYGYPRDAELPAGLSQREKLWS